MNGDTEQAYHERMLRVLVHIQQHLDDALRLEELAAIAHFSPYHFHRVFRGMVGESVMEHVRRLRLERAALRLKQTDAAITHLAFEAGYETHEAFTRAFRRLFDASPSQYRERHQVTPAPRVRSGVHYVPDGKLRDFTSAREESDTMDVKLLKMDPMRVAFVRHTGPYQEVGEAWGRLCGWAGPRGLFGPQTRMLGLCHDDPEVTPPDKIRYDACMTVGPNVQAEGEVGVQETPGGEYAMTVHQGPYENLAKTYAAVCGQWLPQQGREPKSGPSIEIYLNSPEETKPEDLVTEVYVPVS